MANDPLPSLGFDPVTQTPTLGSDHQIDLTFRVKPGANVSDIRVGANVGTIVSVTPQGDHTFVVRFDLPEKRFPQIALIGATAQSDTGRISGFIIVPLKALASPAFETDAGAMVTLKVGEKIFGPVRAGQDGTVRVPIVVPPGIGTAIARSTEAGGKSTEQTIDLGLPDYPRMLVLHPTSVTAGENTLLELFALGPREQPADPTTLSMWHNSRRLTALERRPGFTSFLFPASASNGDVVLQGRQTLPGAAATNRQFALRIRPAPIKSLAISATPDRLELGSDSPTVLKISALDPWGRTRHTQPPALFVDGMPWSVRPKGDESYLAEINAPDAYDGRERIAVDATVPGHHAHDDVLLDGIPTLSTSPDPPRKRPELSESRLSISATTGLTPQSLESAGTWFSIQTLLRVPRLTRVLASVELGLHQSRVSASDAIGISRATTLNLPALGGLTMMVFRVPRFLVLAGVAGGLSSTYFRTTAFGATDATRSFGLAWKATLEGALALGPGQALIGAQYIWFDAPDGKRTGKLTGNTGGAGVTMGYRWLF